MGRTFSSMKFKQPSLGTKAAIFLPFLISWTRAHLRMAELGCLASIPLHSNPSTIQMLFMAKGIGIQDKIGTADASQHQDYPGARTYR